MISTTLPSRPDYEDIKPGDPFGAHYDVVELKMDGQWGNLLGADGTIVFGEYMIGSNRAIRMGTVGHFYAFDIYKAGDLDVHEAHLSERRDILASYLSDVADMPTEVYSRHEKLKAELPDGLQDNLKLLPQYSVLELPTLWGNEVMAGDHEGAVLKCTKASYGARWGRIKKEATMDYIILGFNASKAASKAGVMVQSIRAGLWNPVTKEAFHVCDVGGLTNALSTDMCANPHKYTGLVFEAKGKGVFPSGALRHPAFIRMRDDKKPSDCAFHKVAGDE